MGSRVPAQHYNLRSANSLIGGGATTTTSLHDLNHNNAAVDSHRDSPLNDTHPCAAAAATQHDSFGNSLPLHHEVGVEKIVTVERRQLQREEEEQQQVVEEELQEEEEEEEGSSLENSASSSRHPYDIITLTIADVSPIESARARFLHIIVDHFITHHLVQVPDTITTTTSALDYAPALGSGPDNHLTKRKCGDVLQYEGDPRFALPLMYIANLYETLVNDVNMRLVSLNGLRDKTIGVALEAAGGLYRIIAKKYPKKGSCIFKRRELATSLETRTRFPELVIQEERRVRFVVVNGLDIVEKPNDMPIEDAEWFKRLTGRNEVSVSAQDYKFYSPRHKYRRVMSNIPGLSTLPVADNSSTMDTPQGFHSVSQPQNQQQSVSKHHVRSLLHPSHFHSVHQNHHQQVYPGQHANHFTQTHQCGPPTNLPEIPHGSHSSTISQHMAYLQPVPGGSVGGRLHLMPTSPAKFCDECGAPYLRETSKFCSECGTKRLGT